LNCQLRVVGKLNAQTGLESKSGDRPRTLPGRVQLAVFPFRNQGQQGGFTLGFVGELLCGAQGGLRVAGGQRAKGLTKLGEPLGFVHGCGRFFGRWPGDSACGGGTRLRP
jgi:hypothetical protein